MQHLWKRVLASFLVTIMVGVLCVGCGEGNGGGKVKIVIGEITDLTGPASPATIPVHAAIVDLARYFNDEGLIPGAEIEMIVYDDQWNPARDVPGYEWCRQRGAEVIMAIFAAAGETLKPFAIKDKVPILSSSSTKAMIDPPGWVFASSCGYAEQMYTIMKWIVEEEWDVQSKGPAKVGFVGWADPAGVSQGKAVTEYCQAHPDQYTLVNSYLVPPGTMSFPSEVQGLRDCDFVSVFAYPLAFFLDEYRNKGYDATFFSDTSAGSYRGFYINKVGWQKINGMLSSFVTRWWGEDNPMVKLAEDLLVKYRPGEAEEIIWAGQAYVGALSSFYPVFDILRETIESVGLENYTGQAYYDTAIKYEVQLEGFPKWYYTDTERNLMHHVAIYEWSAQEEDLIRISDWLPLVKE